MPYVMNKLQEPLNESSGTVPENSLRAMSFPEPSLVTHLVQDKI